MKTILPLSLLIEPDKNDPNPLVLYHGHNCPDGFAAALAAWLFFDGNAEFLGLDHGDVKSVDDLPALNGRAVYILDFSFSSEILRSIEERAAKLVLLDHHKSAADRLAGFVCRSTSTLRNTVWADWAQSLTPRTTSSRAPTGICSASTLA